eukprot:Gb_32018 [translate_table: standard]
MMDVMNSESRSIREGPEWLEGLLHCNYFSPCMLHKSAKLERNHFCIDCIEGPICSVGLGSAHCGHRTLQIRKASHHDAIRTSDIQKVIDISGIQCYSINGAKIVFLLRPKAKLHDGRSKRRCVSCNRGLNDTGMLMCSIKCKLNAIRDNFDQDHSISLHLNAERSPDIYKHRLNHYCPDSFERYSYSPNLEILSLGFPKGEKDSMYCAQGPNDDGGGQKIFRTKMGEEFMSPIKKRRTDQNCNSLHPVSPNSVLHSYGTGKITSCCSLEDKGFKSVGEESPVSQQKPSSGLMSDSFRKKRRKGIPRRAPMY